MKYSKNIIIYTDTNCPYCEATKSLLDFNEIKYEEIEYTKFPKKLIKKTELLEEKGPPIIVVNEKIIGSYQQLVELITKGNFLKNIDNENSNNCDNGRIKEGNLDRCTCAQQFPKVYS